MSHITRLLSNLRLRKNSSTTITNWYNVLVIFKQIRVGVSTFLKVRFVWYKRSFLCLHTGCLPGDYRFLSSVTITIEPKIFDRRRAWKLELFDMKPDCVFNPPEFIVSDWRHVWMNNNSLRLAIVRDFSCARTLLNHNENYTAWTVQLRRWMLFFTISAV